MTPLEPSAILEGRTTNRHSVWLIIGLVVSGVCLLVALGSYVALSLQTMTGPVAVVIGSVLALPTTVIMVGLVLLIDRLEPEPKAKLAFVFLWGAGVAILVALVINTAEAYLFWIPMFGERTGEYYSAAFGAPPVEETCKGAVLLLLLWRRRDEINGPTDGIVYAAMVGLGFALVENVNYYIQAISNGEMMHAGTGAVVISVLITVALRGIGSPLAHPLFTSMTGLGVAYAANHRGARAFLAIVGGWIGAMTLHFIWNFGTGIGPQIVIFTLGSIVAYVILACVLAGLIVILVRDRKRIIGLIQKYLPPYGQYGIVTPSDLQMLSTLSARRAARGWAGGQFGPGGKKAMGEYQLAATELALLHRHAESRTVEERRFYIRRDQLVGLMRATRSVFAPASGPPQAGPGPNRPGYGGQQPYGGQGPYGGQAPYGQAPYGRPPQSGPPQTPYGGGNPYGRPGQPPYGGPPR